MSATLHSSFPRKREPRAGDVRLPWIPAFAGMTMEWGDLGGNRSRAFVLALILAAATWLAPDSVLAQIRSSNLPQDVIAFATRRAGCEHWSQLAAKSANAKEYDEPMR